MAQNGKWLKGTSPIPVKGANQPGVDIYVAVDNISVITPLEDRAVYLVKTNGETFTLRDCILLDDIDEILPEGG